MQPYAGVFIGFLFCVRLYALLILRVVHEHRGRAGSRDASECEADAEADGRETGGCNAHTETDGFAPTGNTMCAFHGTSCCCTSDAVDL